MYRGKLEDAAPPSRWYRRRTLQWTIVLALSSIAGLLWLDCKYEGLGCKIHMRMEDKKHE